MLKSIDAKKNLSAKKIKKSPQAWFSLSDEKPRRTQNSQKKKIKKTSEINGLKNYLSASPITPFTFKNRIKAS